MSTNKQPQKQTQLDRNIVSAEMMEVYKGVIPHPDILQGFKNVDPSIPERILKMTEANNEAGIYLQKSEVKLKKRGQTFAFLIVLLGFALSIFF